MPITDKFIVSAPSRAALAAVMLQAGIHVWTETGPQAVAPNLTSYCGSEVDGTAHIFVVLTVKDQATLDAVKAVIGLQNINTAQAPLRLLAGGLAPKDESYPMAAVSAALEKRGEMTLWRSAIEAVAVKTGDKAVFYRWEKALAVTMAEPWFVAIVDEFAVLKPLPNQAARVAWFTALKTMATAMAAQSSSPV